MRVKQPLSESLTFHLGLVGIIAACMIYMLISSYQHSRNSKDQTVPSLPQLAKGFIEIITPEKNEVESLFDEDPSPKKETTGEFLSSLKNSKLYKDSAATSRRLFLGMVAGCTISVIVGVLMGCCEILGAVLTPPLTFLSKMPPTALLALFFILCGVGEQMYVAMIGFGIFPILALSVCLSVKTDVQEEEINVAYSLGANHIEVVCNVVFRKILPRILDAVRLQIGPAMVYLIAAEMLVGQVGMGYQIRMQQRTQNYTFVYDYILVLGVAGLFLDRFMILARNILCPWSVKLK